MTGMCVHTCRFHLRYETSQSQGPALGYFCLLPDTKVPVTSDEATTSLLSIQSFDRVYETKETSEVNQKRLHEAHSQLLNSQRPRESSGNNAQPWRSEKTLYWESPHRLLLPSGTQ